jgi:hypothetical protein
MNGAGNSADCGRFYNIATAAIATMHGLHATAQVGTGGTVSGLAAGVRATLATSASLTPGGTGVSLRLDSDLASAYANGAFLGLWDVNTQKMPFFLNMVGVAAGSGTAYKSGTASTFTNGGLRVLLPDGSTGYIPIGTTCS